MQKYHSLNPGMLELQDTRLMDLKKTKKIYDGQQLEFLEPGVPQQVHAQRAHKWILK